jgi:CheY-like chemotaxis protein
MKADDRWKKIPIIIVTGVSEDMRKFLSSRHQIPPPDGYLTKPINREEILALIQKLTAP